MSARAEGLRPKREFVMLAKVDFPDDPPKKVFLPQKMGQLLLLATDALDLPREAQQVFNRDGKRITSIEEIPPKSLVLISCSKPMPDIDAEPIYKSRIPKFGAKKPFVPVKQPQVKEARADAKKHQLIASASFSVKENIRDSLIALYNSLTPEHKAQLQCSEALKQLTDETAQYMIEHFMLSQFIGPTSDILATETGKETWDWCINSIKGMRPDDLRITITGPERSGKSTILSFLTSIILQKLIISGESKNYLLCVINWYQHQSYAGDTNKLFEIFLEASLEGLKAAKMQFIPIIHEMQQWLIHTATSASMPQLPPVLANFPGFPAQALLRLGQQISSSYNNKSNFKVFIRECVRLPFNISQCFGFKTSICVFDHLDLSGYIIQLNSANSYGDEPQILLSEIICDFLNETPFIVSSLNDSDFSKIFTVDDKVKNFTTERLITSKIGTAICVEEPLLTITYDKCRGCPAYCALYQKIIDLSKLANNNVIVKSKYSKVQSFVDRTRRTLVKQELGKFLSLLLADDDGFDNEVSISATDVNRFISMDEINVKLQ